MKTKLFAEMKRVLRRWGQLEKTIPHSFTFDDMILEPQKAGRIKPEDIDLSVRLSDKLRLKVPFMSAAMDTITEWEAAIVMARFGGVGVIHRNMSFDKQILEVEKVKRAETIIIARPYTFFLDSKIKEVREKRKELKISSFPVIDRNGRHKGIITKTDVRMANDDDNVEKYMSLWRASAILVADNINETEELLKKAEEIFKRERIEKIPVINGNFELVALITYKDFEKRQLYPDATKDENGQLVVGIAIDDGTSAASLEHISNLINVGADFLVIDNAHGHTDRVVDKIKAVRSAHGREIGLVAGNVVSARATLELLNAGADIVKVGMGAGSICTTQDVTGCGMGQLSAILGCAPAAKEIGKTIIADGGIRFSGDIVKALAAGASAIMAGRLFAATNESPGEIEMRDGIPCKVYRGMGSAEVLRENSSRYVSVDKTKDVLAERAPEGAKCLLPIQGSLEKILRNLHNGVRQGFYNQGALSIDELQRKTKFFRRTQATIYEGRPHDIENIIG